MEKELLKIIQEMLKENQELCKVGKVNEVYDMTSFRDMAKFVKELSPKAKDNLEYEYKKSIINLIESMSVGIFIVWCILAIVAIIARAV